MNFGLRMLSSKKIYKKAQYVKQIKASDLVEATRDPCRQLCSLLLELSLEPWQRSAFRALETGGLSKVRNTNE